MSGNRRDFFTKLSSIWASVFAGRSLLAAQQTNGPQSGMGQMDHMQHGNMQHPSSTQPSTQVRVAPGNSSNASSGSVTVVTLDIADLPFTIDNGVKVFNLIANR